MNRKESKAARDLLISEFIEGKYYSVQEIIEKMFKAKNPLSYLLAERKVRAWMSSIKSILDKKYGVSFGCIDEDGKYGVIQSEEEIMFLATRKRALIEGISRNLRKEISYGVKQGLLPQGKIKSDAIDLPKIALPILKEK